MKYEVLAISLLNAVQKMTQRKDTGLKEVCRWFLKEVKHLQMASCRANKRQAQDKFAEAVVPTEKSHLGCLQGKPPFVS